MSRFGDWHTMDVIEEAPIRASPVLDRFGDPYVFKREYKIGFDLRPNNGKKDKLQEGRVGSHTKDGEPRASI